MGLWRWGFLIPIPKYARKHAEKHLFSLSVCMQMAKNRARYFPHDLLVEFPAPFSFASKDTFASSLCHHLILVVITERWNIANDNNKTRENENSSLRVSYVTLPKNASVHRFGVTQWTVFQNSWFSPPCEARVKRWDLCCEIFSDLFDSVAF